MDFRSLFRRPARPSSRGRSIPVGQRVYAVGDVHGRLDLMIDLLARIETDDQARGPAETHVIFLGDLVDRGPRSAQIIDYVGNGLPAFATFHFIMGNHEEAMLRALEGDADAAMGWLQFGGLETLMSYGAPVSALNPFDPDFARELRRHVPLEHLKLLASFEDSIAFGDYLFVHAGIRPGNPLDRQDGSDLRWIRREFLESRRDHGAIVVHGHTISAEPELLDNRIGIDTGAYATGRLTALGLEAADRWILDTAGYWGAEIPSPGTIVPPDTDEPL